MYLILLFVNTKEYTVDKKHPRFHKYVHMNVDSFFAETCHIDSTLAEPTKADRVSGIRSFESIKSA